MWQTKNSTNAINEGTNRMNGMNEKQERDRKKKKNGNIGSSSTSYMCIYISVQKEERWTRQHKFLLNYEHFICSLSLARFTKRLSIRVHFFLVSHNQQLAEKVSILRFVFCHEDSNVLSWRLLCGKAVEATEWLLSIDVRFKIFQVQ